MLKLLFIRHGESTGNRDQRMTSHLEDELTLTGQQQCQSLGHRLHQQGWRPSHIYTSPLYRAVESLAYLCQPWEWPLPSELPHIPTILKDALSPDQVVPLTLPPTDLPVIAVAEALQEFQAGILTGLTWTEAKQHYPVLCQSLETSREWVAIPEAETPLQGQQRARRFIQQLLTQHRNGDAVWIITHHWILEHLIAVLMGCDRTWQMPIANTALFEFWIDCDRWSQAGMTLGISDHWQIKRFGDCQHLMEDSASIDASR